MSQHVYCVRHKNREKSKSSFAFYFCYAYSIFTELKLIQSNVIQSAHRGVPLEPTGPTGLVNNYEFFEDLEQCLQNQLGLVVI